MKKLGVGGVAAVTGVPVATGNAAADTFTFTVNQYPAKYNDSEAGNYHPNGNESLTIEYSHTWGVDITHVQENNGEHLFGVNLNTNAITRWQDDSIDEPCGAIYEQQLAVQWPDAAAAEDEVVFRDNDEWIAGHTYNGGEDKTWAEKHSEDVASYLIDLGTETLGTPASVAMSTGGFLLDTFSTVTDNSNEKKYAWNYDGASDNDTYPGATEGAAWIHFHVYVDEGEETSFTIRTRHDLLYGLDRGVEYEFVLQPPA